MASLFFLFCDYKCYNEHFPTKYLCTCMFIFPSLGYICTNKTVGSKSMHIIFKNFDTYCLFAIEEIHTIYSSIDTTPCQHWALPLFYYLMIKWIENDILRCIFLMINEVQHPICCLNACFSSFVNYLLIMIFIHFPTAVFIFFLSSSSDNTNIFLRPTIC